MAKFRIFNPNWMKPFHDIHKHLGKNEHWFQYPEKKKAKFDEDFTKWHDEWHPNFTKNISEIEKTMKEFEKKMEE